MLPFRKHHLLILLKKASDPLPLDLLLSRYFRLNKAIGSKDRRIIADTIYGITRWKGLIDFLIEGEITDEKRIDLYETFQSKEHQNNKSIPDHIKVSFPPFLFDAIKNTHGHKKALEICLNSNTKAPPTIRVNTLKISREDLLSIWEDLPCSPTLYAENGIVFQKKYNFFALPEFKKGYFEMQDEGSQLIASLMKPKPGDWTLDFCAGSGGKTLGFAPLLKNQGQIFLSDIRDRVLLEAKKRLKRAGIQNGQTISQEKLLSGKYTKKMDSILLDVPCSGTGTLRRNPDQKWKIDEQAIERLIKTQRDIFEKAFPLLKPTGKLLYATCSLLKQENEEQVEFFLKNYPLKLAGEPFHSLPTPGGMDGFFAALFERKSP